MVRATFVMSLTLGVLILAGPVFSAEVTGKGQCVFAPPVVNESFELPDGQTVQRVSAKGTCLAEDPAHPWHLSSQFCASTQVLEADGATMTAGNYCEVLNAEGDVAWRWDVGSSSGGRWGAFGGTGKFEGIGGGGTYELQTALPDGGAVYRWQGTLKMK